MSGSRSTPSVSPCWARRKRSRRWACSAFGKAGPSPDAQVCSTGEATGDVAAETRAGPVRAAAPRRCAACGAGRPAGSPLRATRPGSAPGRAAGRRGPAGRRCRPRGGHRGTGPRRPADAGAPARSRPPSRSRSGSLRHSVSGSSGRPSASSRSHEPSAPDPWPWAPSRRYVRRVGGDQEAVADALAAEPAGTSRSRRSVKWRARSLAGRPPAGSLRYQRGPVARAVRSASIPAAAKASATWPSSCSSVTHSARAAA
ncbi:hypothetical protein SALBM217S_04238 [Streptomyces griseoloalbus]